MWHPSAHTQTPSGRERGGEQGHLQLLQTANLLRSCFLQQKGLRRGCQPTSSCHLEWSAVFPRVGRCEQKR